MLTPVLDLEPVSTAIIVLGRARGLGHVKRDRALVVDRCVEGESKGTAGLDGNSVRGSTASTLVASQIVRCQVGDGRVVIAVLADVVEDRVLGTTDAQLLEDVVSRHALGSEQRRQRRNCEMLHDRQR